MAWLGLRCHTFLIGLEGLLGESRGRVGGQHHAPAAFTPGKDTVPIVQEAGWASEQVWIDAENLAPTGIRSPDLQACSESLYRLRYLGSIYIYKVVQI
jgi:hypothetical protein